jgi:hypothetical protein
LFVLAIFSILTIVTVYNYGDFNDNIVLTNLAYEVSLEIRQAQFYALGVRSSGETMSREAEFNIRRGIFFDLDQDGGNTTLATFSDPINEADSNSNYWCDQLDSSEDCILANCGIGNSECDQTLSLTRGIVIEDVCYGASTDLFSNGACINSTASAAAISFQRPNPDAYIRVNGGSTADNIGLILKAPNNSRRGVVVGSTGQITVENLNEE